MGKILDYCCTLHFNTLLIWITLSSIQSIRRKLATLHCPVSLKILAVSCPALLTVSVAPEDVDGLSESEPAAVKSRQLPFQIFYSLRHGLLIELIPGSSVTGHIHVYCHQRKLSPLLPLQLKPYNNKLKRKKKKVTCSPNTKCYDSVKPKGNKQQPE